MAHVKVAFKSGNSYLTKLPHRRKSPAGLWGDLNDALLFDMEYYGLDQYRWPLVLHAFGMESDGGRETEDYFRKYMFPAGRPQRVIVDIVERQ